MDNNEKIELGQTEELLLQFAPRPVNIDRERLMFLAGQAEAESRNCRLSLRERLAFRGVKGDYWPLAALAMTGVAAVLAIAIGIQLSQPLKERIVVREVQVPVPQPVVAQAAPPREVRPAIARAPSAARTVTGSVLPGIQLALPTSSVFQMRNTALRFGVEALPETPNETPAKSAAPSAWGHFHELREVEATTKAGL